MVHRLAQDLVERLVVSQRTADYLFGPTGTREAWQWEWPVANTHTRTHTHTLTHTHTHPPPTTFIGHGSPHSYTLFPPPSKTHQRFVVDRRLLWEASLQTVIFISSLSFQIHNKDLTFIQVHSFPSQHYTSIDSTQLEALYFSDDDVLFVFEKKKKKSIKIHL